MFVGYICSCFLLGMYRYSLLVFDFTFRSVNKDVPISLVCVSSNGILEYGTAFLEGQRFWKGFW